MEHVGQRTLSGQQLALARRDAQAEQQCRVPRQRAGETRPEQVAETSKRPLPLGVIGIAAKQCAQIDAVETGEEMGKPDETAERAVPVESIAEVAVARPPVRSRPSQNARVFGLSSGRSAAR